VSTDFAFADTIETQLSELGGTTGDQGKRSGHVGGSLLYPPGPPSVPAAGPSLAEAAEIEDSLGLGFGTSFENDDYEEADELHGDRGGNERGFRGKPGDDDDETRRGSRSGMQPSSTSGSGNYGSGSGSRASELGLGGGVSVAAAARRTHGLSDTGVDDAGVAASGPGARIRSAGRTPIASGDLEDNSDDDDYDDNKGQERV